MAGEGILPWEVGDEAYTTNHSPAPSAKVMNWYRLCLQFPIWVRSIQRGTSYTPYIPKTNDGLPFMYTYEQILTYCMCDNP